MNREINTILIAEDSAADAEMAIDALREAKLANPIVHVEDGVEALDYLLHRGAFVGRGTADMKGFVALAVDALRRAAQADLRAPLALLLTADEELGSLRAGLRLTSPPAVGCGAVRSRCDRPCCAPCVRRRRGCRSRAARARPR